MAVARRSAHKLSQVPWRRWAVLGRKLGSPASSLGFGGAGAAQRGRGGRPAPRSLTLAGPALPSPLPQLGLLWPAEAPCAAGVAGPGRPAGSFPPGGGGAGVWAQAGRRGPGSTFTCRAGPAPVYVFGGGESCSPWAWSATWTCPRVVDEKYITEKYRIWMKGWEAEGVAVPLSLSPPAGPRGLWEGRAEVASAKVPPCRMGADVQNLVRSAEPAFCSPVACGLS